MNLDPDDAVPALEAVAAALAKFDALEMNADDDDEPCCYNCC